MVSLALALAGDGLLLLLQDTLVEVADNHPRQPLIMDEEALTDRIGILASYFERLFQDFVGGKAAIDKSLDIADPIFNDLALLFKIGLAAGFAMSRYDRLHIERFDTLQRCQPLPRIAFLEPAAAFVKDIVAGEHDPFFRHQDRGLRRGVAGHMDDVE